MDKQVVVDHFAGGFLSFYQPYLPDLRKSGKQFMARCCFHADHTPSLSINPDTGQYHCFGCGAEGDMFTFYGRKHGLEGDFPAVIAGIAAEFGIVGNGSRRPEPERAKTPKKPKHHPEPLGPVVATYDYTDEQGGLLYQVRKHEPKTFRPWHPDGKGGWISGMEGVQRVLYRLPAVLAADEIWWVEGEKDADNLAALGMVATTSPQGAKSYKPEFGYANSLVDKQVIVIPDADAPGRSYARRVAASLQGKATSIKMIELPAGFKDASDLIAAHPGSVARDMLLRLLEVTPEWTPSDPVGQEPEAEDSAAAEGEPAQHHQERICDEKGECFLEPLTEADTDNSTGYEWYIPRLVPKGHPMLIASKGGVGKTTQALSCAGTIMAEHPDAYIVYIAAEGTYRDTKIKARRMGLDKFGGRFTFLKRKDGGTTFKLSEKEDLPLVQKVLASAKAKRIKIAMIIIDSIRGMYRGKMSEDLVGSVMNDINGMVAAEAPHCTIAYLSHNNKVRDLADLCDQVLGSVTIINAVRHALVMVKTAGQTRTIEVIKTNLEGEGDRFRCVMGDDGRIATSFTGSRGQGDQDDDCAVDHGQRDRADELILSMLKDGDEIPAAAIYQGGEGMDPPIHAETIKQAKKAYGAGILSFQKGKRWYWRMEGFLVKELAAKAKGQAVQMGLKV